MDDINNEKKQRKTNNSFPLTSLHVTLHYNEKFKKRYKLLNFITISFCTIVPRTFCVYLYEKRREATLVSVPNI